MLNTGDWIKFHTWNTVSGSGLPSTRETQSYWRESSSGPLNCWRHWNISSMRKDWGSCDGLAWRRPRFGILLMCTIMTWWEDSNKWEPGSFQWCPVTEKEVMHSSWNTGGFSEYWEKGFLLWQSQRTGTGFSEMGEAQCPREVALLEQGLLGQMTSRGLFQPEPFLDSVTSDCKEAVNSDQTYTIFSLFLWSWEAQTFPMIQT